MISNPSNLYLCSSSCRIKYQHVLFRLPGLSPELRALALIYGHDSTDDRHWDFLWKLYVDSPVDTDRKFIMKAFALYREKSRVTQ